MSARAVRTEAEASSLRVFADSFFVRFDGFAAKSTSTAILDSSYGQSLASLLSLNHRILLNWVFDVV